MSIPHQAHLRVVSWIPATSAGMTKNCASSGQAKVEVIPGLVPGIQRATIWTPDLRPEMRTYYTYILASRPRGTLYIGVTNGLIRRVHQHRTGTASSFTLKYRLHRLVWFESFSSAKEAIQREKTMKEWPRAWKINLIERTNPHWIDLFPPLPGATLVSQKES